MIVVVVIVIDVLMLARIIKSVVTGQAPVTLEWRETQKKSSDHTAALYIIEIKIHFNCEIEDFVELIFASCV